MSEESALRFLALLNRLWDGNPFDRRRTTRESVTIEGRRFTVALMLQPIVLARLLEAGSGLARGTGNLARFLVCWPESTMGARPYRPIQAASMAGDPLEAFDRRLIELLNLPLPVEDPATMKLQPTVLDLSPEAFEVWRAFHDEVERELGARGEYGELSDFGAKAAEQAARLAAVLHVFEHGPQGTIGAEAMQAGAALAAWHLHEARRVLSLTGRTGELSDAQALLDWLLEQPQPPTAGDVLRLGPYRLRDKDRRDAALSKLVEHGLARLERHGRATLVVVNPAARGATT
jgi:putative DNA primase/helicase